jgi:hypothetical protein
VSRALEVVSAIEGLGGHLTLGEGGAIRYRVPKHNSMAQALLEQLRQEKPALIAYLKARATEVAGKKQESGNRGDSDLRERMEASVRQFGQPHARLFPFLDKRVWTPQGPGKLLSVFATRCEVHLEGTHETIRVLTGEVRVIQ